MPKHLGQHFLKNSAVADKIIKAVDIGTGDTIVEIGPGRGALTIALAEAVEGAHARVIAIEKDAKLIGPLSEKLGKNIEIMHGDALDILPSMVFDVKTTKIVGNIPYYITGHLLRTISELKTKPAWCIFMIQKEVAERIMAEPPRMNRLSASVRFWAEPKIIMHVDRRDFSPPPEIDSAVILLKTKAAKGDPESYYAAVRAIFAQPRKTIINNLFDSQEGSTKKDTKEKVAATLEKIGIAPLSRPQNLTTMDIESIANHFFKKSGTG
jgi:16S rRNA (adenine1518-N6/adenine1519-N6)-dimethyltransferase